MISTLGKIIGIFVIIEQPYLKVCYLPCISHFACHKQPKTFLPSVMSTGSWQLQGKTERPKCQWRTHWLAALNPKRTREPPEPRRARSLEPPGSWHKHKSIIRLWAHSVYPTICLCVCVYLSNRASSVSLSKCSPTQRCGRSQNR